MTSYADHIDSHRRLAILAHLAHCDEYRSNTDILSDICNDLGITTSRDQLNTTLAWLAEQALVTLAPCGSSITLVTATLRGVDVALGRARVPGVQRPQPRR